MNRSTLYYGWKPDLPDHRDYKFNAPARILQNLPPRIDLRDSCPPVYDQGELGSCTSNAIAGAFEFELIKQKLPVFIPSRLFIYYNERVIENTVNNDAGAYIRDGMSVVNNQGVCTEDIWPYVINEFTHKPYLACYQAALQNTVTSYHSVSRDLDQMRGCLADGYPFVFGFSVYQSFESLDVQTSGIVNLPRPDENMVGGHAVLAVGYDDQSSRFIVRNSWGDDWGMDGYFTMPYEYLLNEDLSDNFWTIRLITNNPKQ
ncbi:MAG: peptidase [Mucilaginibacter sp.]|nr:peptidase [Mucilaginibacter sp.]